MTTIKEARARRAEIDCLAKAGVRQSQIARQVGLSRQRVHQVLKGKSLLYRRGSEEARNLEYLRPLITQIHHRARLAESRRTESVPLERGREIVARRSRRGVTSRLYLKIEFLKRGLTISDVARRVGCSRGHLSRVVSGRAVLDDKLARDIALATGIPKVIVLGGLEIPQERPQGCADGGSTGKGDAEPAGAVCGCSGVSREE